PCGVKLPFVPGITAFVIVAPWAPNAKPNCWEPGGNVMWSVYMGPLPLAVHVSPDGGAVVCAATLAAETAANASIAGRAVLFIVSPSLCERIAPRSGDANGLCGYGPCSGGDSPDTHVLRLSPQAPREDCPAAG